MNYFNDITTLDQLKNEFRKLSMKLHPDTSGYDSQADFVKMYAEFKNLSKRLKFTTGHKADETFDADKFYNRMQHFNGLKDIKVSFVGSFIWLEDEVKGAMYQQKDAIKAIRLDGYNFARWARKKVSWYFSPQDYKQLSKGKKTLEQIKSTYGCNSFKTKQGKFLSA